MSNLIEVQPEYLYTSIPREYVGVYHRILAMMADYGEDMLKDCKASCTERNSGVIECFNMFNSAVAARKLGNTKLAETLINYVKAKIEMIYNGKDNSTSFIYPLDEYGELNAIVSGGDPVKFEIDADKGELYQLKYADGFKSWYDLSKIQGGVNNNDNSSIPADELLYVIPTIEPMINQNSNNKIWINFNFNNLNLYQNIHAGVSIESYINANNDIIFNFYTVSNVKVNGKEFPTLASDSCSPFVNIDNYSDALYNTIYEAYDYMDITFNIEKFSLNKEQFLTMLDMIAVETGYMESNIIIAYRRINMLISASLKDWNDIGWNLSNYKELFDFRDSCRTAIYEGFSFKYDNRNYEMIQSS